MVEEERLNCRWLQGCGVKKFYTCKETVKMTREEIMKTIEEKNILLVDFEKLIAGGNDA